MLGIIGGMGPAASALFYEMITEKTGAERDQDNLNLMLLSHASMPDRTAAILSGKAEEVNKVKDLLLEDSLMLAERGCDAITVTCNTAHYFIDMIKDEVPVPFIHLIEGTAKRAAEDCPKGKIAVLATDGTIKTGLYQKALEEQGLEPYAPDEEIQAMVMHQIYGRIKAGYEGEADVWQKIEDAVIAAGCHGAVLGCTELSVINRQFNLGDKMELMYFDPMEIMAENCIEFFRARGEIK